MPVIKTQLEEEWQVTSHSPSRAAKMEAAHVWVAAALNLKNRVP